MENTGMTFTAMIRSFVQYVVAAVLSLGPVLAAIDFLITEVKIPIDKTVITVALEGLVFSLVVGGLIKLGTKFPWINKFMSFGRSGSSPVYVPAGDVSVGATVTPIGTTVFTESGTGIEAPPVFEEKPPTN